jgi:anti-sigma-K factor RskA
MNREEIGELAAAYALGRLEAADRARFEALLRRGDPDAVAALRAFEDTLAGLAGDASDTPMDRIAGAPVPARAPAPAGPLPRPRGSIWPVVLSGAMAAGLAAIVVGWSVSSTYEKRLDALARDADELKAALRNQQTVLGILRDPGTQVVVLGGLPPAPGARARVMWHEKAGGLFLATGLPVPPAGKAYQLWAIAGSNAPVSAGVFSVDASGGASLSVRPLPGVTTVSAFAVTLEPADGLPAPSGEMYLLGKP